MKHIGTQILETERIILRPFKLEDAKKMFENYTSHEVVTKYLTWLAHKTLQDTIDFLEQVVLPGYNSIENYRWAVVLKENGEVIGSIDVVKQNDSDEQCELGWVLGDAYWGKGIMPECAKVVLKYLFDIGYIRIYAIHDHENAKSGRVMGKIGMKHEGLLRKFHKNNKGELVDCDMWAIIKGDNESY